LVFTKPPGFDINGFLASKKEYQCGDKTNEKIKTKYLYDPLLFLLALNL